MTKAKEAFDEVTGKGNTELERLEKMLPMQLRIFMRRLIIQ